MGPGVRRIPCPALGAEVELPEHVDRIVSLSPSLTDAVFRLGLGSRLVGRSAWCWRPGGVEELPVVGSYTGVRRDRLEELAPDLVLTTSGVQEELARKLAGEGVPVYQLPLPVTPWGILENLTTTAVVCGEPGAAHGPLEALWAALSGCRGVLPPLETYVEIDLGEAVTVGAGSYLLWSLEWLGLRPVTREDPRAWFSPDGRWLEELAPRLVLYDPQPRRGSTIETVRETLAGRGLGSWFERGAVLVVTEGDVLAHHGPWLLEEGLPWIVRTVQQAMGDAPPVSGGDP